MGRGREGGVGGVGGKRMAYIDDVKIFLDTHNHVLPHPGNRFWDIRK